MSSLSKPRTLSEDDGEAIYQILNNAPATPGSPAWNMTAVCEALRQYSGLGLDDEQGLASFILFRDVPGSREILHLASAPRVRRQGWMERLLAHLLNQQPPETALWLEVHEENTAARKLYEKAGFEKVGERPRYYADGGTAILYNLS